MSMDVHYQRFLRRQFKSYGDLFEFPQRHQFNVMLDLFVAVAPEGYEEPDYGENTFRILLPATEYGDMKRNWLSETRERIFKQKVRDYYEWIVTEQIGRLMKGSRGNDPVSLNRKECTLALIDEYGFDDGDSDSYDRLYKLVSRYNKREMERRYRVERKERAPQPPEGGMEKAKAEAKAVDDLPFTD